MRSNNTILSLITLLLGLMVSSATPSPALAQVPATTSAGSSDVEIAPLIDKLKDPKREVRTQAARSLESIGEAARPAVTALTTDENWKLRYWSLEILGSIGAKGVEEVLAKGLQDDVRFVRQNARRALKKRNTPEALSLLEEDVKTSLRKVKTLIEQKQFRDADIILENLREVAETDASVHALLAYHAFARNKFVDAEKSYDAAIALNPNLAILHENLGRVRLAAGNRDGAKTALRSACELDSKTLSPRRSLARLLLEDEEYLSAIELLRTINVLAPEDTQEKLNLAQALRLAGELEEALVIAKEIAESNPKDAMALGSLGNSYFLLGRLSEAEKAYKKSLELKPSVAMHQNNLGVILERQGLLLRAKEKYQEAKKIDASRKAFKDNYTRVANAISEKR